MTGIMSQIPNSRFYLYYLPDPIRGNQLSSKYTKYVGNQLHSFKGPSLFRFPNWNHPIGMRSHATKKNNNTSTQWNRNDEFSGNRNFPLNLECSKLIESVKLLLPQRQRRLQWCRRGGFLAFFCSMSRGRFVEKFFPTEKAVKLMPTVCTEWEYVSRPAARWLGV